ncbi:SDH family Clp fold serine proteinase [Ferrovibrio xuzhouensis]|uniref:ATP-dependent Clp protease proteolytic subunit n=1 Tax=Ferrovibrio xuzhouensis TaxID=1576914 RepID=A0ABV7VIG8_9PROT
MSFGDLFWLFFIFMALQPMLRQRLLILMRARKLLQLQKARGTRVITLVHRQETMRLLGFPLVRYIDIDDAEDVIRAIRDTDPETPIDIILHTPGGLVIASLQIASALSQHRGKVTAIVPQLAMSGGTLIALAADQIIMAPHAMLGPIDPQIGGFPAASLARVVRDKPIARIDDQTLIYADIGEKATHQVSIAACKLLSRYMPEDKAVALADKLTRGQWTHDYPITAEEAIELGLPVSTGLPEEVADLMALYPQPVRTTPTVEYVPAPVPRQPRRNGS